MSANTQDSAAQGAMDRNQLVDEALAKIATIGTIGAMKWLGAQYLNSSKPSDATAQPVMGVLESFVNEVAIGAYKQDELRPKALQALRRCKAAQGKPDHFRDAAEMVATRNFCADCGKRTPEGSIHTCAPAYAVEQADHIVDANKMVDDSDPNAEWLTTAHIICSDAGIPQGHIQWRLDVLRDYHIRDAAQMVVEQEEDAKLLSDVRHALERQRVWSGQGWSYNPLQPRDYLPILKRIDAALQSAGDNNALAAKKG